MDRGLEQIYNEDIADRRKNIPDNQLEENDRQRLAVARNIVDKSENLSAKEYHQAALIFQHGETVGDIKKAHELAMKAVELGDESARWLAAASLDRSLLMEGKPQKYGTQFKLNSNKEWEMALPIDPDITDEERAKWMVPPLKNALKIYKQKYNL